MTLNDIIATAEEYLRVHDLSRKGWVFRFDSAALRFGCCKLRSREITMSKKLALLNLENNFDVINDVILHEIAHALTRQDFGNVPAHGKEWKKVCREIGARPQRCYDDGGVQVAQVNGKFVYVCPNCGKKFHHYRKLRTDRACGDCCNKFNGGKYNYKFKIELVTSDKNLQLQENILTL